VVLSVIDAVECGASAADAAGVARGVAAQADLLAALPTMRAVEQNASLPDATPGRVGAVMPSLFRFHAGTVTHVGDVRPGVEPVDALAQACAGCTGPALVFHAAEDRLARRLASQLPGRPRVVPFSPAMAIHTGPGWIGVAWLGASPTAPVGQGPRSDRR
jgi:hypothetical protein